MYRFLNVSENGFVKILRGNSTFSLSTVLDVLPIDIPVNGESHPGVAIIVAAYPPYNEIRIYDFRDAMDRDQFIDAFLYRRDLHMGFIH